jgi:hypothetical protein
MGLKCIFSALLLFAVGCAQGGSSTLEKSGRIGSLGGGAIPAGALASILPNGGGCPAGYSVPAGAGDLAKVCVHTYGSGTQQSVVVEDVKLVNGACAVDYVLVSSFGSQSLCVKSANAGQQTALVTMLYEVSGLCASGDTMSGAETVTLSLCEAH